MDWFWLVFKHYFSFFLSSFFPSNSLPNIQQFIWFWWPYFDEAIFLNHCTWIKLFKSFKLQCTDTLRHSVWLFGSIVWIACPTLLSCISFIDSLPKCLQVFVLLKQIYLSFRQQLRYHLHIYRFLFYYYLLSSSLSFSLSLFPLTFHSSAILQFLVNKQKGFSKPLPSTLASYLWLKPKKRQKTNNNNKSMSIIFTCQVVGCKDSLRLWLFLCSSSCPCKQLTAGFSFFHYPFHLLIVFFCLFVCF